MTDQDEAVRSALHLADNDWPVPHCTLARSSSETPTTGISNRIEDGQGR